jgi:hypothetical protein
MATSTKKTLVFFLLILAAMVVEAQLAAGDGDAKQVKKSIPASVGLS